jgi:hypothetical protein
MRVGPSRPQQLRMRDHRSTNVESWLSQAHELVSQSKIWRCLACDIRPINNNTWKEERHESTKLASINYFSLFIQ